MIAEKAADPAKAAAEPAPRGARPQMLAEPDSEFGAWRYSTTATG